MPLIAVHRVDLTREPALDALSREELERVAAFKIEHARRAFAACRSALRDLLAQRLGVGPCDVDLRASAHGKPYVPGGKMSFSVSHSADVGLIAVADGAHRLGVDVERIDEGLDFASLAQWYFDPAEAAAVGTRARAFFRCWTRKEAVVKAIGLGLSHPLDSFAVDVDARRPAPVRGVADLVVVPVAVGDGYEAAIAADAPAEIALIDEGVRAWRAG